MLGDSLQEWKTYTVGFVDRLKQFRDMLSTAKDVYGDLLGVDVDDSSVLAVQLRSSLGSIRLSHVGVEGVSSGAIIEDNIVDNVAFTTLMKALILEAQVKNKNVVIAMPGSKVAIKQIKLEAHLSDDEAESRAWQEARKAFPELVKNLYLDFAQVERQGIAGNKKYTLILVVTRKEDIAPRIESMEQAGLAPKIVDVDYYALERAYALFASQLPMNHAESYVAMIDFNPHSIVLVVMHKKSMMYFNRQSYTGDVLVPFVQRAMGVAIAPVKAKPVLLTALIAPMQVQSLTDYNDNIITTLTEDQKSHIVMTIRRLFQSFYTEHAGHVIDHIVMTGRCALISEITEYVSKMLDISMTVANPFLTMKMSEYVDAKRFIKLGPAFALSCGLAMRGIPLWK